MSAAIVQPAAPIRVDNLHEDFARLPSEQLRVDEAAGIIYGVKVLGFKSPNRHGIAGISGTEYDRAAVEAAIPLYEGIGCYKNHPRRDQPKSDRDVDDRIGWLENVHLEEDGLYADLHLLTTDVSAPKILESARKNPKLFAMSHNATGIGEVRDSKYVVTEIPDVRSVDIVTEGGTTRSLRESAANDAAPVPATDLQPDAAAAQTQPAKTKAPGTKKMATKAFRQIFESRNKDAKLKSRWAKLLEDDAYGGMMTEDPPAPEATAPAPGHLDHLGELIKAILLDGALDDPAKVDKIKKALGILDAGSAPAEAVSPVPEGEEPDAKKDDDKDKPAMESLQREVASLRAKDMARDLFESIDYTPSREELADVMAIPDAGARERVAKAFKAAKLPAAPANGVRPRTATVPLKESANTSATTTQKPDPAAFVAAICN